MHPVISEWCANLVILSYRARYFLLAIAVIAYWPFTLMVLYYEFLAPCLRGGEGLLPGLFVGGPVIIAATVLVWLMREMVSLTPLLRASIIASLGLAAGVVISQVIRVTVLGEHPCGEDYAAFNAFVEQSDRWIPVANLVLISIAALVGLGPWVRKVDRTR